MKTVVFLTFAFILNDPFLNFGPILGQWVKKLVFWVTARDHRADFLCLLPEQNISNTLRCFCLVFFDDVGIEVLCCACAGVSQLSCHGDNIGSICQQDGSHGMPLRYNYDKPGKP